LLSLLRNEKPTHLAVAFDISRASFRTREYPEYKGTRNATPPEFLGQIPLLQEALAAMNITTISKEDFEADDILATLSVEGTAAGYNVLVVSGDRDAIQLVNETVTLLYPVSPHPLRPGPGARTLRHRARAVPRRRSPRR